MRVIVKIRNLMRSILLMASLLCWLILAPAHSAPSQTGDRYAGDYYLYSRAESYSSVDGSVVTLLKATGFDYFDHTWLPTAVLVEGPLDDETFGVVRRLVDRRADVETIYFDSPGGILDVGLELGLLAHSRQLTTVVNSGADCHSACALAFLGGKHRKILSGPGSFSFHRQYYLVNGRQVYNNWERDVAQIAKYLKAVGATAVTAPEVVGTTGQASFTDAQARERRLTTLSLTEHYQFILATAGPSTVYERFRVACHALEKQILCQSNPLLREPAIRTYARLSRELGALKDLDRAGRGLLTMAVQFRDATAEEILAHDCLLGGESFFDNLDVRFVEASTSSRAPDKSRFERTRANLHAKCNSLRQRR